jgi:hypothetical protein
MAKKYTKPDLRERLKKKIMAGSKGGKPGQWSARKAQLLAKEYEGKGGGYSARRDAAQKSLKKWSKQEWTTESGKPSGETGEVYAPKKTIEQLRGTDKLKKANKAKREATKKGKQHAKHGLHKGKKR